MIVAKIQVNDAIANTVYRKVIPAGIIGAQVQFDYAVDPWDGLHKTVVFRGAVTKDVITDAEVVTIPAEVVAKRGYPLRVGVYGVDADGNLAIPTIWADLGTVRDAADPSGDLSTDPSMPVWAQIEAKIGNLDALDTTDKNNLVAAVNEALKRGGGEVDPTDIQRIVDDYLAANPPTVTETDPTVPTWAKQPQKPTYTAVEVGALPDTYTPPNQTAQQVGADPAGTAASAVSHHNTDAAAHNDLRIALQGLSDRINAVLDSDDTTLDQMSEVVAYIKSNKSLIDAITTSKVSVADIVNDLATNVADKPLSAAQGVAIKTLIDALRNDKLDAAELTNAVNTALAQAKASGEFDGQDGATPNIQIGTVETLAAGSYATASMGGTPENPILNLGIPQGAPGSGGPGIAVTGATVGQTVKIAAVDENGVPTAWEAVDLPDSGGNVDQSDSVFKGKTASFYGDSLTEVNGHYTKGYHAWVKDLLGLASYNNYGVSGYKVSDVYDKVNSVTDTADIIFVMCGVNDQTFSVPLGTMGDNTTGTTYGALNLLCALLKQKYPTSIVVLITPHYQTKYPHSSGITSYEVSKAIREVCEKYAIPVYDNFVLSGIYSTNLSTFTTDNCHWNDIAHEMVGKNLAKFVTDSFRYVYDDETDVTLTNISATYVGGDVTVGTAITELTGIVVTAHYSDGSTKTVTGYTLSGEIVEGENSITVSYGGKTTTFTVTGVSSPGESIVEVVMSDVGELVSISYLNDGRTAMYEGWETYNKKLEVSGYSSITGRFCCHYLPFVANVPYIVFFGKEDEVVGWEGLKINVGESEKEDEKGGYGYSIERTFAIPDGAVTAALNGTTYFFDAYYNSGTYLLSRAK